MGFVEEYEGFVCRYEVWKYEGLTDNEIANIMNVTKNVVYRLKKYYGLCPTKCIRKNQQGLTESELKIADKNGVSRRLALRRVREYGWEIQDAIHTPKGLWCGNYGGTVQEREEKKRRKQREYYEMRKRKVLR